jgi:hypothetical protein
MVRDYTSADGSSEIFCAIILVIPLPVSPGDRLGPILFLSPNQEGPFRADGRPCKKHS